MKNASKVMSVIAEEMQNQNEPAHKSAKPTSDTNTAEMEENFYQGYQGWLKSREKIAAFKNKK